MQATWKHIIDAFGVCEGIFWSIDGGIWAKSGGAQGQLLA